MKWVREIIHKLKCARVLLGCIIIGGMYGGWRGQAMIL